MRKNNNMKGKYSLFKNIKEEDNKEENKEEQEKIDNEKLVNNLITKINDIKERMAIEGKNKNFRKKI